MFARGATRVLHVIVRPPSLVMPLSGMPDWLDGCRSAASTPAVACGMNGQLRLSWFLWKGVRVFARGALCALHLIVQSSCLVMPSSGMPD